MSEWISVEDNPMPVNELCIVYNKWYGRALRSKTEDGDLYDENEILDDSELEPTHWAELIKSPKE